MLQIQYHIIKLNGKTKQTSNLTNFKFYINIGFSLSDSIFPAFIET